MRRDFLILGLSVLYDAFFVVLIVALSFLLLKMSPGGMKPCIDFSAFFLAGRLALQGAAADAYSSARMTGEVSALCGGQIIVPWTYPPPFDLILAPLSLFPFGLAYGVFALLTYAFYCLILRRLSASPGDFLIVRLIAFPAVLLTLLGGQSSLLIAGLIGWFCLSLLGEARGGGAPLGLLVIKPHLAVSATLLALLKKRSSLLMQAAMTTILLTFATTLAFGLEIWPAFLAAAAEAKRFLSEGAVYPLFRMVSVYAAAYTFTGSLLAAFALQAFFSCFCAWAIFKTASLGDPRIAAGVVGLVAAGFSPYAYDYDLTTLGVGAALLLPVMSARASVIEKGLLLTFYFFSVLYGFVFTISLGHDASASPDDLLKGIVHDISTQRLSLGGVAYAGLVLGVLYVLLRAAHATSRITPVPARG